MSWGYVWNRLENDADTKVKGKIGVAIAAARPGRQERDVHRRLAARGVRVLEEQGRKR